MPARRAEHDSPAVSVLVVGDWLVDEYWVVGKHRSSTSTRTGRHHTRALHTAEASVRSLCGAGQVATILHQAEHRGARIFDLRGIGIWHPDDTAALTAMLEPETNIGRTPHRLTERKLRDDERKKIRAGILHNLATGSDIRPGTTRIIRVYESENQQLELMHRLDWELPLTTVQHRKLRRGLRAELAKQFEKDEVSHILVKDLLKGSVDPALITALSERFTTAHWYISSKDWDPVWMKDLPQERVRLIFVPPKAAQRAHARGVIPSRWLIEGVPSKEAIDAVKDFGSRFRLADVIVLPDEWRILAYEAPIAKEKARGFVVSQKPLEDLTTAMASVFFASVVAHSMTRSIRMNGEPMSRGNLEPALQTSLAFTRRWQAAERMRLTNYGWKPQHDQVLSIQDHGHRGNWQSVDWNESQAQWTAAFTGLGLVADTRHRREEFQLWRSMTELSDYVACSPTKRQALNTIIRAGLALRKTHPSERKQKSFMLVDTPGSGKSFLLDCLTSELGFRLMHFNITRIDSKNEIFKFLDDVSRAQRSLHDPVLIFIDEIDAKVGARETYDAFLEPLEDGRFGGFGELAPALWLFAGTRNPGKGKNPESNRVEASASNKADDFVSRLSHPVFDFRQRTKEDRRLAKVEQVYVGVACLIRRFSEITQVSRRVLRAFSLLKMPTPREIRRFVSEFEEVQLSRVMVHNMPQGEWRRRFSAGDVYEPDDEYDLVPIRVHPNQSPVTSHQ